MTRSSAFAKIIQRPLADRRDVLQRKRRDRHFKPGQLAGAELSPPGVKLATADPVHPTRKRGRGAGSHALRQIRSFSSTLQRRRRSGPARTSPRTSRALVRVFPRSSLTTSSPSSIALPLEQGRPESGSPCRLQDGAHLTLTLKARCPRHRDGCACPPRLCRSLPGRHLDPPHRERADADRAVNGGAAIAPSSHP